jgi:hypothetical protein
MSLRNKIELLILFIFKICSLWIIAPFTTGNVQGIQFSSSGLYCLGEDKKKYKMKHYLGSVQVTLSLPLAKN